MGDLQMRSQLPMGLSLITRRHFLRGSGAAAGALALAPLLAAPPAAAQTTRSIEPQSTMLIYTNTNPLASGDFSHVVTLRMVQNQLATFPADWLVSGVGATDWETNVGEVLPRGTAGDLPFWWADPGSPSQADVLDLRADPRGPNAHFQFLGMAIGNPADATSFDMKDVPDVHARIR